jgi:hypothetical protein
MMPAMPVSAAARFVLAAGHGGATGFAQLRAFRHHAGRDFRYVRNNIGAQLHGVGRASLLDFWADFGVDPAIKSTKQYAGQKNRQASKTHDPHMS